MRKLVQYGMMYICSNSDNEYNSSRYYVTSVDESIEVTEYKSYYFGYSFTIFRFMLSLLTRFVHVHVETMGFMDCKM